jgi:hypothetical protein
MHRMTDHQPEKMDLGPGPSKLGRRGDPRMHKAVRARLENPELSLLEALRFGGFVFPVDCSKADDASITDLDGVTLGQRKNQLSRRCRLARQGRGSKQTLTSDTSSPHSSPGSSAAMRDESVISPSELQDMMIPVDDKPQTSERERSASLGSVGGSWPLPGQHHSPEETQHARFAKFHPEYQPLVIPPHIAPSASMSNVPGSKTLFSGSTGTAGSLFQPGAAATTRPAPNANPILSSSLSSTLGGVRPSLHNSSINQHHHHASGVAIASLSKTAASMGLSLEQLAMTLASSSLESLQQLSASTNIPNLPKPQTAEERERLALGMIQFETRALLCKCMMQVGYELHEAREGTPTYFEMALKAWRREQQYLKQHAPSTRDVTVGEEVMKAPDDVTTATKQQSHDHAPTGSEACFHGNHLHDLEGKCGHKPIVHKPVDGPAHVDFLVGNKVECYRDTPVGNANATTVWPSKYKCFQLDCPSEEAHRVCRCGFVGCLHNISAIILTYSPALLLP